MNQCQTTFMTLLNLNNYNVFKDVEFIQYEGVIGSDHNYEILDTSGNLYKFFIPSNKVKYATELLLSYYLQLKFTKLHEHHKSDNLIVFKNFSYANELINFNHRDKEYNYTQFIDMHKVSDEITAFVKNNIIELNLDLIKLNYVHS